MSAPVHEIPRKQASANLSTEVGEALGLNADPSGRLLPWLRQPKPADSVCPHRNLHAARLVQPAAQGPHGEPSDAINDCARALW